MTLLRVEDELSTPVTRRWIHATGQQEDRELLLGAVTVAPPDIARAAQRANVPSLNPRSSARSADQASRVVMNFHVVPESDGWTRVTTETRVHAVNRATQRRSARYWRVIYPGSWIIDGVGCERSRPVSYPETVMMALMQRPIDLDYNGTTQLPTQAATPRCTVGMVLLAVAEVSSQMLRGRARFGL